MKDCWKFHAVPAKRREEIEALRKLYAKVAEGLEGLTGCRYQALAQTALEESCLWMERCLTLCEAEDGKG